MFFFKENNMIFKVPMFKKDWRKPLWLITLTVLFVVKGSLSEEACKFSYLGFPEDLNDSQIVVPEDVVAMSEFVPVGTPTQIIEQFVDGSIPSIFFVIDNSSSMNTQYNEMLVANDLLGARFTVTDAIIDTLFKKCPKAQVGVAVFGSTLFFDPNDDDLFEQCPQEPRGAYIPLLTLEQTYQSTELGSKTGYEILKYYLETDTVVTGMIQFPYLDLVHQPTDGSLGTFQNASTNITAGFRAAKDAMLDSPHPKKDHYVIFYSDGEATEGGNEFEQGTNVPTTFTIYFTSSSQAPQSLLTMTDNIKTNGYSISNPLSNLWPIQAGHDVVLQFLMNNVIGQIINQVITANPVIITVNGLDPVTGWDSTGFTFDELFPLVGPTTEFNFEIDYEVYRDSILDNGDTIQIKVGDTTHNVNFDVVIEDGATVSDKVNIECWDRTLGFYHEGTLISLADETMNELEIRFTEKELDVLYGYKDVSLNITHAAGNSPDTETFSLEDKGDYFSYTFSRHIADPDAGDGALQHQVEDSIIAIFRNPDLPLDTLRLAIPFKLSGSIMLQQAIYFDNDAQGFVDSIFLGMSGTKIEENLDELVDLITLPEKRKFKVTEYAYRYDGIALNVTEGAALPQTYVTEDDILLITDTVYLQNGGWLLPTEDTIMIIDSIAPIIMKATLIDSVVTIMNGANDSLTDLGTDELTVVFSETVEGITDEKPFKYFSNNDDKEFSAQLSLLSQNTNMGRFRVDKLFGVDEIVGGDSIWVNWALKDNVFDAIGNEQDNPKNIRRPIDVQVVKVLIKGPYELVLKTTLFDPDIGYTLPGFFTDNSEVKKMLETVDVDNSGDYKGMSIFMLEPDILENVPDDERYTAKLALFDAVGNTVVSNQEMAYIDETKCLVFLWDGTNMNERAVGPGSYCAVIVIEYLQKPEEIRREVIGVRK